MNARRRVIQKSERRLVANRSTKTKPSPINWDSIRPTIILFPESFRQKMPTYREGLEVTPTLDRKANCGSRLLKSIHRSRLRYLWYPNPNHELHDSKDDGDHRPNQIHRSKPQKNKMSTIHFRSTAERFRRHRHSFFVSTFGPSFRAPLSYQSQLVVKTIRPRAFLPSGPPASSAIPHDFPVHSY